MEPCALTPIHVGQRLVQNNAYPAPAWSDFGSLDSQGLIRQMPFPHLASLLLPKADEVKMIQAGERL